MARHFRSGVDAMIREAELEELQKQWAKENERIMSASSLPDMTAVTPYDPEAAPNPAIAEAAASDGFKPFQTDVAPADSSPAAPLADPEQPALPLDASPNDAPAADAPKGSPA
jgi:sec-independent protein translocase protein TatB